MKIALAVAFVTLIAVDGVFTFWATNNGYTEVNPLMASFAHTLLFPISKIVTALIAIAIVGFFVKHFPKFSWVATIGYSGGVALYTLVLASNLMEVV